MQDSLQQHISPQHGKSPKSAESALPELPTTGKRTSAVSEYSAASGPAREDAILRNSRTYFPETIAEYMYQMSAHGHVMIPSTTGHGIVEEEGQDEQDEPETEQGAGHKEQALPQRDEEPVIERTTDPYGTFEPPRQATILEDPAAEAAAEAAGDESMRAALAARASYPNPVSEINVHGAPYYQTPRVKESPLPPLPTTPAQSKLADPSLPPGGMRPSELFAGKGVKWELTDWSKERQAAAKADQTQKDEFNQWLKSRRQLLRTVYTPPSSSQDSQVSQAPAKAPKSPENMQPATPSNKPTSSRPSPGAREEPPKLPLSHMSTSSSLHLLDRFLLSDSEPAVDVSLVDFASQDKDLPGVRAAQEALAKPELPELSRLDERQAPVASAKQAPAASAEKLPPPPVVHYARYALHEHHEPNTPASPKKGVPHLAQRTPVAEVPDSRTIGRLPSTKRTSPISPIHNHDMYSQGQSYPHGRPNFSPRDTAHGHLQDTWSPALMPTSHSASASQSGYPMPQSPVLSSPSSGSRPLHAYPYDTEGYPSVLPIDGNMRTRGYGTPTGRFYNQLPSAPAHNPGAYGPYHTNMPLRPGQYASADRVPHHGPLSRQPLALSPQDAYTQASHGQPLHQIYAHPNHTAPLGSYGDHSASVYNMSAPAGYIDESNEPNTSAYLQQYGGRSGHLHADPPGVMHHSTPKLDQMAGTVPLHKLNMHPTQQFDAVRGTGVPETSFISESALPTGHAQTRFPNKSSPSLHQAPIPSAPESEGGLRFVSKPRHKKSQGSLSQSWRSGGNHRRGASSGGSRWAALFREDARDALNKI